MKWLLILVLFIVQISCSNSNFEPLDAPISKGGSDSPLPEPAPDNDVDLPTPDKPPANFTVCYSETSCFETENLPNDSGYLDPQNHSLPRGFDPIQYKPPVRAISLNHYDGSDSLSKNFLLSEFMSIQKGPFGILSPPVLDSIQHIRNEIGTAVFVTSGYRSPNYNSTISGAAKWSRHQYGDAVDFYSSGASLEELKSYCLNLGATYTSIYEKHIHCDWRSNELPFPFYELDNPAPLLDKVMLAYHKETTIHVRRGPDYDILTPITIDPEDGSKGLKHAWSIRDEFGTSQKHIFFSDKPFKWFHQNKTYHITLDIGGSIKIHMTVPR